MSPQTRCATLPNPYPRADNSLGAVDNDDGSSYYYTHDNFFSYGGGGMYPRQNPDRHPPAAPTDPNPVNRGPHALTLLPSLFLSSLLFSSLSSPGLKNDFQGHDK